MTTIPMRRNLWLFSANNMVNNSFSKLFLLVTALALACGAPSTQLKKSFYWNVPETTTVGSIMIYWEIGTPKTEADGSEPEINWTRKELIYTGDEGDIIHITYREYSSDQAGYSLQPELTQQLTYDLSNSNKIGFQDITILIEKADQEEIRFRVLDGPAPFSHRSTH